MNLEISFDMDSDEIKMTVDNSMVITARKTCEGRIAYSKNISDIIDDQMYDTITGICELIFNKMNTNV